VSGNQDERDVQDVLEGKATALCCSAGDQEAAKHLASLQSWGFSPDLENGPMAAKSEGARPRAMKARDAGKYIGVGRTKLKELIASGAFPGAYKNGRDHIVPVSDLDAFVDAQAAAARAARSKAPFVGPAPGAPLISDASSHSATLIEEAHGPNVTAGANPTGAGGGRCA
jgi:hypothetical protein